MTPKYRFTLKADSQGERDKWFEAINNVTSMNNKDLILSKNKTSRKMVKSMRQRIEVPIS